MTPFSNQVKPFPRLPFVYTFPLLPPSHSGSAIRICFSPRDVTFMPSRYRTCTKPVVRTSWPPSNVMTAAAAIVHACVGPSLKLPEWPQGNAALCRLPSFSSANANRSTISCFAFCPSRTSDCCFFLAAASCLPLSASHEASSPFRSCCSINQHAAAWTPRQRHLGSVVQCTQTVSALEDCALSCHGH